MPPTPTPTSNPTLRFLCGGTAVLFIGGGGRRPPQMEWSKGGEQQRQQHPTPLSLSFVGLFPVGRLCAGWMAAFEDTRAAIELRVKAGA